nr:reverse transcriptase domain-containing protein [Tanacetum cinerariifolium]
MHLSEEANRKSGQVKRGEQAKAKKKGEAPNKEKATENFMVYSWQRITRQKTTQSFSADQEISFSTLGDNNGQETPIVIEAEKPNDSGNNPLLGFSGEISWPLGQISLMVTLGDEEHSTSALMNFMVVRSSSPYNVIIGRPGLRKIQVVPSTAHGMLKFLVEGGIATIHSSTIMPAECRMVTEAQDASPPREPTATKGIKEAIHPEYPKQSVMIGGSLSEKRRMELCNLLKENFDIFAWKPADMTGILRSIAEHHLNVRKGCQPIRQKRRGQAPDRNKAIQEEVSKLVEAEIMRELYFTNPRNQLQLNGKTSFSVGARHEEAEEILPSTPSGDGSSCLEGSGAGLILTSPEGEEFTYALRFEFDASNNEAEYEALMAGLRIAEQMSVKNLIVKVDSRLVANQINELYEAKEQSVAQYLEKAKTLINNFKIFSIGQVSRNENKKAGALIKIASTSFAHLTKQVLVETLKRKSIEERKILAVVEEKGHCWMTPLIEYLATSFLEPWLRCFGPAQAKYVVKEIHEGSCCMHSGPRSVVAKAIRFGFSGEIISDNEKQFRDNPFKDCLREGIKAGLGEDNRNWVKELPHVLRAHRTMIKTSNRDTSFSLSYGTEALIPVEIGMPSLRCAKVNQAKNNKGLLFNIDILEERREKAAVCEARNKTKMEKYYNAKVHSISFHPRYFVYRSNEASHAKESGKLGPKWEGPYEVVEALGRGAYNLMNESEDILPRTWNVQDLKKYYL